MIDVKLVTQAVGELDEDRVITALKEFVASSPTEDEALSAVNACQQGMAIVGDLFEKGEYFVGDLIFAGELLTRAIDTIKPVLQGKSSSKIGKIVLGTVRGDMHDIGKNIFKSMIEGAGFEVYDLGIDQPTENFVQKIKEVNPDIVGLSGVLTTALDSMKVIVDGLKKAGLRESVRIIIGGSPVTKEANESIKADAYTTNAAEGVKICRQWVKN